MLILLQIRGIMRIISRKALKDFWACHTQAEKPLKNWFEEASQATWKTSQDIKTLYRSADFVLGNRVIFNIGGNKYRLIVKINYSYGVVYIRFIGTHTEYDKINAETI
jgi:mRNA interferase HigB